MAWKLSIYVGSCLIVAVLLCVFPETVSSETEHALFIKKDAIRQVDKRQTKPKEQSADVMVQNILKWLQNIYGQNNRKTRQGPREYLPPLNTEKPRPFQTGGPYPASGSETPQPGFPSYPSGPTDAPHGSTTGGPLTVDLGTSGGGRGDIYQPGPTSTGPENNYVSQPPYTPEGTAGSGIAVSPSGPVTILTPDDDDRHPPHIHAIDVQCSKEQMTVNLEFNKVYNGLIYSKGFYNNPACRYVTEDSGQTRYTFTLSLNNCGTEFITAFDTEGQSYLENVLVLQNEAGIQEVWDSIRSVRCLWEGNINQALSVALSVGMLTQEIVTFSGDTAMARLDIQMGRGPFAPAATGLVKIGEIMTLVVSVTGDPDFDIQVRECKARDQTGDHTVVLTDSNGCVLKPKLFGAFQKTKETQNTGASILAFAFFSAFKFPDVMDLILECNIELCKTDCQVCPIPNQSIEPRKRRRRSLVEKTVWDKYASLRYRRNADSAISEPVKVSHGIRVIMPGDIQEDLHADNAAVVFNVGHGMGHDGICMSMPGFLFLGITLVLLLLVSALFSTITWLKYQRLKCKF